MTDTEATFSAVTELARRLDHTAEGDTRFYPFRREAIPATAYRTHHRGLYYVTPEPEGSRCHLSFPFEPQRAVANALDEAAVTEALGRPPEEDADRHEAAARRLADAETEVEVDVAERVRAQLDRAAVLSEVRTSERGAVMAVYVHREAVPTVTEYGVTAHRDDVRAVTGYGRDAIEAYEALIDLDAVGERGTETEAEAGPEPDDDAPGGKTMFQ